MIEDEDPQDQHETARQTQDDGWEMTQSPRREVMVLNLEGFEGPLDLLLALARTQKVDLLSISILALADQYIDFIKRARELSLELAADYLVMAAWLAYLKSRLLLPPEPDDEGPSGEEMAAILAFRLKRLEAMRDVAARLFNRDRLGRDVFSRGMPEGVRAITRSEYRLSFYELLKAYSDSRVRDLAPPRMHIRRPHIYSIEDALARLKRLLGNVPDWSVLEQFLPDLAGETEGNAVRSAVASTFVAALEMVRRGHAEIQQHDTFAPIYLRAREGEPEAEDMSPERYEP